MLNLDDLQIERHIIPLFDHTNNGNSRESLRGLFFDLPPSVAEITERQAMLKGFMANAAALAHFAFHRMEVDEVYLLLEKAAKGKTGVRKNRAVRAFRLFVHRHQRYRAASRYLQMINLFERLDARSLALVDTAAFPPAFGERITRMRQFMRCFIPGSRAEPGRRGMLPVSVILRTEDTIALKAAAGEIRLFWETFFLFDACLSVARTIQKLGFVFPEFGGTALAVEGFYHPCLEKPVKNTLVTDRRVILLTGPNMSGKSTLLKALGLCAYLAHAGLAVPAAQCRIPFCPSLSCTIDLKDDMGNGYSHFMSEVKNLKAVIGGVIAGKKTLALFDELFRSTNHEEALEITQQTIEGLLRFSGSWFIISTHLNVTELAEQHKEELAVYQMSCQTEGAEPVFGYRLQQGCSVMKVGKILFEKEGLHQLLRTPWPSRSSDTKS